MIFRLLKVYNFSQLKWNMIIRMTNHKKFKLQMNSGIILINIHE